MLSNQWSSRVYIGTPEQLKQWYTYRRYVFHALPLARLAVRARLTFASVHLKYAKKNTPVLYASYLHVLGVI